MQQNNQQNNRIPKSQIFYARTYRHLQFNLRDCLIFTFLCVIPLTVLFLLYYDELAALMCSIAAWFLRRAAGLDPEILSAEFIPALGNVNYLSIQSNSPGASFILANMAFTLAAAGILFLKPLRGKPLPIYLDIALFVHMTACVFFLLGKELFPYEITDYSKLYVQQQVGIWITFLVLIGLVEGILGRGALLFRLLIMTAVVLYSFLFGTLRYCLFLWILHQFSVMYLPVMFFSLGPFFDFLYFVMIYAFSANYMIKKNENKFRNDWAWG